MPRTHSRNSVVSSLSMAALNSACEILPELSLSMKWNTSMGSADTADTTSSGGIFLPTAAFVENGTIDVAACGRRHWARRGAATCCQRQAGTRAPWTEATAALMPRAAAAVADAPRQRTIWLMATVAVVQEGQEEEEHEVDGRRTYKEEKQSTRRALPQTVGSASDLSCERQSSDSAAVITDSST